MIKQITIFSLVLLLLNSIATAQSPKITISEINYKGDKTRDAQDWLELWNFGNSTVDVSGWVLQGEKFNEFFVIPQGTIIASDQRIVLARDDIQFNTIYPDVDVIGPFVFRLSGKGQNIRLYDNSNTLFQEIWYQDSIPWPKTPDGHGKTLELVNPNDDVNDGNNWFAGCILGSPGKEFSKCNEKIIFSEINTSSETPMKAGDWVELRNIGNSVVDISGWYFTNRKDSLHFVIPQNSFISPGQNVILARRDKFYDYYPDTIKVLFPFEFGLRSEREVLKLYDKDGKVYNSMFFHNQSPWPTLAGTETITMELIDHEKPLCSPTNWMDGCRGGSPGAYYNQANCLFSSVNQFVASENYEIVYPNPFRENTIIEIKSNKLQLNENIYLSVFDLSGRSIREQEFLSIRETGDHESIKINFSANGLKKGVYFYTVSQSKLVISNGKLIISD